MSRPAQTTSKAAQGLLPQIEAAITYLQQEIAQIRAGEKDQCLHDLIADPLPRDQFQALLQVWKLPPVPVELSKLFVQLEELREQEAKEKEAALANEKLEAARASQEAAKAEAEASDGDLREDKEAPAATADANGKGDDVSMESDEEPDEEEVKPAVVNEERESTPVDPVAVATSAAAAAVPQASIIRPPNPPPTVHAGPIAMAASPSSTVPGPKTSEAAREVALVNLRALRKSMMLDVLSKIVSVARSKGVDPAMFSSRQSGVNDHTVTLVDLEMIQRDVTRGFVAEWEHFAQQVYLFCQHVIAESEKNDQPDAKQKGVELLHFAKTLTETLRKASLKKEETLMQKTTPTPPQLPPATPSFAASSKTPVEQVSSEPSVGTPPVSAAESTPTRPSIAETAKPATTLSSAEAAAAQRASARIRLRENSVSDSPTPSPKRRGRPPKIRRDDAEEAAKRKRPRVVTPAGTPTTGATEEHSESESQLSTSEAATSQGDDSKPRQRKRRVLQPATRVSSRMLSRRAAEAAAAAAAATAEDEDDQKDVASPANDEDSAAGYAAHDEKEADTKEMNHEATDDAPPAKPVLLTKSGRPRKKPGRKPKRHLKEAD